MNKREQLDNMRREHARDRAEIRDNEMYTREGEDFTIQMIRDKMARVLHDPEIDAEHRKETLAIMKEEIEVILDQRDEREHDFIEQELQRHQLEQELEQEILNEEREKKPKKTETDEYREKLSQLLYARTSLKVGAEATRKAIQENSRELTEAEQFSTILINNSERDAIPAFTTSRRRIKEALAPEQIARIDTVVAKQREIGMLYKESAQLQESQLKKPPKKELPPPPPEEKPEEIDELEESSDDHAD
ncbi:MAG: hypothetical protein FWB80_13345 [Defluviitaleaceae bacterium]|nr:hypothetical protein [Defluviitaleaceae bacterium]